MQEQDQVLLPDQLACVLEVTPYSAGGHTPAPGGGGVKEGETDEEGHGG